VKATLDALRRIQAAERVAENRGVALPTGAGELVGA
jgi:ribosomal protein S5